MASLKTSERLRAPTSQAMSKTRSNYESSVFLRNYRGAKKDFFSFLAIFDKNTGHRVTKFHPVYRINITYKIYFIIFSLTRIFFWHVFNIRNFGLIIQRRQDRVVGRVVDSKIQIWVRIPLVPTFFFTFFQNTPHLRKAEGFFAKKSSAFF